MSNFASEIIREGKRVTLIPDYSTENPFDWGWEGLFFESKHRNRIDSGDEGIKHRIEGWKEDLDSAMEELESATREAWESATREAWGVAEDFDLEPMLNAIAAYKDTLENRPRILEIDTSDHRIYVDCEEFTRTMMIDDPFDEDIIVLVENLHSTYMLWAEGDVWFMESWTWNDEDEDWEEVDSLGGVQFNNWCDDDEVWTYAVESLEM